MGGILEFPGKVEGEWLLDWISEGKGEGKCSLYMYMYHIYPCISYPVYKSSPHFGAQK